MTPPTANANANSPRDRNTATRNTDTAPPPARLWTVDDLARFLRVPVNTIYKWRANGEGPPAYRLGKHLRFDEHQVHEWLRTRRDPT
jgi:excisionase family DNA binding protein